MYMRRATPIVISPETSEQLEKYARGRSIPKRLVERSKIILMAANGAFNTDIASELGISRPTVQLWRDRFIEQGIPGIEKDATRSGRKPKLSAAKVRRVIKATLETTPRDATHWSVRTMAEAQGISRMAVQRIWSSTIFLAW